MLKQTFLINTNLKMGKGKIAVQVAHGEVFYMNAIHDRKSDTCMEERFHDWFNDGVMKKVVLKATEKEMRDIVIQLRRKDIWEHPVIDMGLTQVAQDSFTCLVIEPLPEEQCQKLFEHLKLL